MRTSGLEMIGSVPWGTHFCQFYKTPQDLIDILVPYFKTGLENNEFCMWITSEPLGRDEARQALGTAMPDLDDYVRDGQIEILDYSEWYTPTGKFECDRVLDGWVEKERAALERGFDGLRLTGNTFWLEKEDWGDFSRYEAVINDVIKHHRMIAMCTYSMDRCGAFEVIDVVSNHQFALIQQSGKWQIIESESHKKVEASLRESEERYRTLVDLCPLTIAVHRDGKYLYVNPAGARLFGAASPAEVVGRDVLALVHPDDRTAVAERIRRLGDGTATTTPVRESRILRVDGGTAEVMAAAAVVTYEGKPAIQLVLQDNSDRVRAERALREAKDLAEAANRAKDDFIATVSHELRTPLNAILGWADLLRRGDLDRETLEQGLEVIDRNGRVEAQIISDLLDMSRIVSGKLRLEVQNCDLGRILEMAVDSVAPSAGAKGIAIRKTIDSLAGPVSGDPSRLQQVFTNLLTNSIKFTPAGGSIQVLLERADSHIEVTVSDSGCGISPDLLPHIFERYRQADSSRKHEGLGLGLAIVKHLVDLHGGAVRAKSPGESRGATFVVSFPVIAVHALREPGPRLDGRLAAQVKPHALGGVKVLIVDDEKDTRDLLRRVLEEQRADVVTASSAMEALARIRERVPDVLVSDIGMSGEDGYELMRSVRRLAAAEGGAVPAIALTAYAKAEDRAQALIAGFQCHLAKPVEPWELVATIASLWDLEARRRRGSGS